MAPLYPKAVQKPLTGHSRPGKIAQRSEVVMHITEGTTASGAMSTFAYSKAPVDGGKGLTSAHFVIDRDGTVYQLISVDDTAWHASQANGHSIGVEHVALSAFGAKDLNTIYASKIAAGTQKPWVEMLATDAQYQASAELCAWLCRLMNVAVDRAHIRTHNEASPIDEHVLCCVGGLDINKVVSMAQALNVKP